MKDAYPGVKIVTAWVDEKLNEQKYIVPGLGGNFDFSLFPSLDSIAFLEDSRSSTFFSSDIQH